MSEIDKMNDKPRPLGRGGGQNIKQQVQNLQNQVNIE